MSGVNELIHFCRCWHQIITHASWRYEEEGVWAVMECECCTWDHAVQALDVLLGDAALRAHLVDEAGNKPDHGVCRVAVLRVLEPALRVEALGHAASDAADINDDAVRLRKGHGAASKRRGCMLTCPDKEQRMAG